MEGLSMVEQMRLPIEIKMVVKSHNGDLDRTITLNSGLTILLGPNGSGKTHLLRALKKPLEDLIGPKKLVRFMSAGRIGPLESYRSDFDGHRSGNLMYDNANFGSKGDVPRRIKIETLNGDFQTLSERVDIFVMIQERLRKLLRRDVHISWDAGDLRIHFSRTDRRGDPYSSGREASGLLHLVGILCALYNDEVGALLIDEPEVSLHPQLQAFLLEEMRRLCGLPDEQSNRKLIVIATHSTELMPLSNVADLPSIVFCYDLQQDPVQVSPMLGELSNNKVRSLVAQLGQDHKLSLFSKRPLVVEGPSDKIMCSALSRRLDMHLEASGSQLLPAIGTGQMPVVVKFLRMLGKSPVVLADADAIADGLDLVHDYVAAEPRADEMAQAHGHRTAKAFAKAVFDAFCQAVESGWTEISPHAQKHPYWTNERQHEVATKRRAAFATLFSPDKDAQAAVQASVTWRGAKTQVTSLLDYLEELGCFILRRGSIESYYQSSDPATSKGKPAAAVEEMVRIESLPVEQVQTDYADIARCLATASTAKPIVEAEALRDLLLAVLAPAAARLTNASFDDVELQTLARGILGERVSLFVLTATDRTLKVALRSSVLTVPGLPLTLNAGDDVVKSVNAALKLVPA